MAEAALPLRVAGAGAGTAARPGGACPPERAHLGLPARRRPAVRHPLPTARSGGETAADRPRRCPLGRPRFAHPAPADLPASAAGWTTHRCGRDGPAVAAGAGARRRRTGRRGPGGCGATPSPHDGRGRRSARSTRGRSGPAGGDRSRRRRVRRQPFAAQVRRRRAGGGPGPARARQAGERLLGQPAASVAVCRRGPDGRGLPASRQCAGIALPP